MKRPLFALALSLTLVTARLAVAESNAADGFNYGETLYLQGNFDGAIKRCTVWLKQNPKDPRAYIVRGNAKRYKGDLDGAVADYTGAIELNPKDAWPYFERGVVHYLKRGWLQAGSDFDVAGRQDGTGGYDHYGTLMACVVRIRRGDDEAGRKKLRKGLEKMAAANREWVEKGGGMIDSWPSQIGNFLLGKTDEAGLLKSAKSPNPNWAIWQRCAAWYFAGMKRLAVGQKAEATKCFHESVATKQKTLHEYILATAELKWLEEK